MLIKLLVLLLYLVDWYLVTYSLDTQNLMVLNLIEDKINENLVSKYYISWILWVWVSINYRDQSKNCNNISKNWFLELPLQVLFIFASSLTIHILSPLSIWVWVLCSQNRDELIYWCVLSLPLILSMNVSPYLRSSTLW